MTKICDIAAGAEAKLPPGFPDKSGVGVHYVDAFIKPMNVTLADGRVVTCKRRGLKIMLKAGDRKGEGLLRRLTVGPDPVAMLKAALQEAASVAGLELSVSGDGVYLDA